MFASLKWIYALAVLSLLSFVKSANQPTKEFIVDTDLFDAIDDSAALLLASTLPNTKLLAVNVNVNSTFSALAASAIVNYYGYSSIPIGLRRPYANATSSEPFGKEYASRVAARWSGGSVPWFEVNKTLDPVELYRKTLGEAKNGSITIISLGYMGSLSGLLNSTADKYSSLDGYGLVKAKVKELVVMGGGYLAERSLDQEYNFAIQEAPHVVNTWPSLVPMTFIGAELGMQVLTGARLTTCGPSGDPVRTSFEWWGGANVSQYSWDHLAVAYAGRGLGNWFEYANTNGYNYVYPNGTNIWVDDKRITNQHYLKLKTSNETVAKGLEDLLLRGAWANAQVD